MFTNKHVVIAMIVAPVLALLAWVGVGQISGEKPQAAVQGQSYPLVEKSNCRYASGACDLENEDFRLRITMADSVTGPELVLTATHPLDGVVMSVAQAAQDSTPSPMRASDGQGLQWRLALGQPPGAQQRIRLVANASGRSYFADASTSFLQTEVD